jgi:hypothetical protein
VTNFNFQIFTSDKYWAPGDNGNDDNGNDDNGNDDNGNDDNETTSTITRKESPRPTELANLNVKNKLQIVLLCHVTLYFQKVLACIKKTF